MASVKAARDAGATTVAVTSFSRSPITEFAQVVLVAGGPETSFLLEAMTSRTAHLSVLDALFVAVAAGTRERANVALDATADVLSQHRAVSFRLFILDCRAPIADGFCRMGRLFCKMLWTHEHSRFCRRIRLPSARTPSPHGDEGLSFVNGAPDAILGGMRARRNEGWNISLRL